MFSTRRPREMTLTHALGVRQNQERVPLPPPVSSGGRDVLQSQRFVFQGIQNDPMAYCKQVANRLHERQQAGDEALRGVTAVELATSRFDVLAYFASAAGRTPLARQVYARCQVAP
jgi:hypothetical protein